MSGKGCCLALCKTAAQTGVWDDTNSSIPAAAGPGSHLLLVSAAVVLGSLTDRGPGALLDGSQPSSRRSRAGSAPLHSAGQVHHKMLELRGTRGVFGHLRKS